MSRRVPTGQARLYFASIALLFFGGPIDSLRSLRVTWISTNTKSDTATAHVTHSQLRRLREAFEFLCLRVCDVRSGFAHGYAVTSGNCDGSIYGDLRYLRYFMRWCDVICVYLCDLWAAMVR